MKKMQDIEIFSLLQLTDSQRIEVQDLYQLCKKKDLLKAELEIDESLNFYTDAPCFFLAYTTDTNPILVGFLFTFCPNYNEAEIKAFVHPDYRRQHIFTNLVEAAKVVIQDFMFDYILYVVEPNAYCAKEVLSQMNLTKPVEFDHQEYTLKYNPKDHDKIPSLSLSGEMKITPVDNKTKAIALSIAGAAFFELPSDFSHLIESSIQLPNRQLLLLTIAGFPGGIIGIGEEESHMYIYAFAIHPRFQRQGFGKKLLAQALITALEKGKGKDVFIDVDVANPRALDLYQHLGFVIISQMNYYRETLLTEEVFD